MAFTPLRRVISALQGREVDMVPVTSIAGCGGIATVDMQNVARIPLLEAHRDPESMARLSLACHKLTGIENARVPFDFVVEPEALGCEVKWWERPEILPSVKSHPFNNPADLTMPDTLLESGRIPVVLQAIRIARDEVVDFLPISSLALGPFSLAGELAGMADFLKWTLRKPEYVEEFVDFTTDFVIEYAGAQYSAGSNVVEVADSMASLDMISPTAFKEFAKPALAKIARELKGLKVLHICGRTEPILGDVLELGFDGVSLDVDIPHLKSVAGDTKVLGNVSSKGTLVLGSTDDVKAEARNALEAGVDLLEPDCGFSPITPTKNIEALVEARNEYYQ